MKQSINNEITIIENKGNEKCLKYSKYTGQHSTQPPSSSHVMNESGLKKAEWSSHKQNLHSNILSNGIIFVDKLWLSQTRQLVEGDETFDFIKIPFLQSNP